MWICLPAEAIQRQVPVSLALVFELGVDEAIQRQVPVFLALVLELGVVGAGLVMAEV